MNLRNGEIKKLFSFREIYIGLFLCLGILAIFFYSDGQPDSNYTFWMEIQEFIPRIGFWFIAIMIVVGLSRLFPFEREAGMYELLKTYRYGKTKLVFFKILTVFIYSFLIVTLFYLAAIGFYGSVYSIGDVNMPMSEAHYTNEWSYMNIGRFTQWQFLLYEYVYMIFATFSFGLFVVLISLLVKSGLATMVICGGLFAIFELYDKYISFIYLGKLFSYFIHFPFGFLYEFGYNGMLSLEYSRTVDLPQICILILYLFGTIAINIWLIYKVYRRKEKC